MQLGSMLRHALSAAAAGACLVIAPMAMAEDAAVTGKIEWGRLGRRGWLPALVGGWRHRRLHGAPARSEDWQAGLPEDDKLPDRKHRYLLRDGKRHADGGGPARSWRPIFRQAGAFSYSIAGHTDSRGSDAYNQGLSEARAAAVADVARSVGAVVDSVTGYGESQPVASNGSAKGMAKNRRVEVMLQEGLTA